MPNSGKGLTVRIEGDGTGAARALEMVREQLRATQRETNQTTEVIERLKGALETVGLYMGIREGIDLLKELTEGSAEFGEQMQKAAVKTGMTVETLSVLHYAADLAHTDFDGLQGGIGKLAINLESAANGNSKLAATFHAAGIDAKELAKQPDGVDQAFKRLATTLANTENAQKRDALAKALMGKAGVELIPVLMDVGSHFDELAAGADKAGVKMDELRAQRLAALDDELDKLKEHAKGAGLEFTDGLANGLIKVFDIINEGASTENTMQTWGENTGKVIARLAALFYDLAAAAEAAFAFAEGSGLTERSRRDIDAYNNLLEKGRQLENLANGDTDENIMRKASNATLDADTGRFVDKLLKPKHPLGGAGDLPSTAKPGKSGNPIDEARAQLAQEQARLRLELVKAEGQAELAELEAQHRMLLVTDQEYYDRKFAIQNKDFDAEQTRLESQQKTLTDLYNKQHGDRLLKRDKQGSSAEELKTQRELVQVQEQLAGVAAKRKAAESGYNAEVNASNVAAELTGLRAAAMLERERGQGIEAQIALIRREKELEAQKATNSGGTLQDAENIRQQGELAAKKLQLQDVQDDINNVEAEHRRRRDEINDAVTKGDLSKRSAAAQTRAANAQEQRDLQALIAKYRELAEAIGDPALIEKVKDLDQQMSDLGRKDNRGTFGKELADNMQSMTNSIVENAARGKQSFGQMALSILDDLDRMAIKMAEEKFIAPLFDAAMGGGSGGASGAPTGTGGGFGSWLKSIFGAGGEHHMSGGIGSDMPQIVGDEGGYGELWTPPTRGGQYTTSQVLKRLAEGGSNSKAPNVSFNLANHSSQPVQAQQGAMQWDSDAHRFVQEVLLTDLHEGGRVAQALGR